MFLPDLEIFVIHRQTTMVLAKLWLPQTLESLSLLLLPETLFEPSLENGMLRSNLRH